MVWTFPVLVLAARASADDATEWRLRELAERVERLERRLEERDREGMLPLGALLDRARRGDPEARERLKRVVAEIHEVLGAHEKGPGPGAHAKKREKAAPPEALRKEIAARLERFEREMHEPGAPRDLLEERIFRHQMALKVLEEVDRKRAAMKAAAEAGRVEDVDAAERWIRERLESVHELMDLGAGGPEADERRARQEKLARRIAELEGRLHEAERKGSEQQAEELREALARWREAQDLGAKALAVAEELRRANAGDDRARQEELRRKLAELDAKIEARLQKLR